MTNPWEGIKERKEQQALKEQQEYDEFIKSYSPDDYCMHLRKEKSHFVCKAMSIGALVENINVNSAKLNCCKDCNSGCPNFMSLGQRKEQLELIRQEELKRYQLLNEIETSFDDTNEQHKSYAEYELREMEDEELHKLYDICLDKTKDCWEYKKELYQLDLLAKYPISHKQNLLLNALRHTNEYASRIEYTTYKEMQFRGN